jgi:putative addiction module CopG family antidote
MDISLRPDLEKFLSDRIQSGRFVSSDDAMNEAVQLLKETEEAEGRLENLLAEAESSGPATEVTPQDWLDIENEGLKRLKSRKSA